MDGFSLPQSEKQLHEIHKSFSHFPTKFKNISGEMKEKLKQNCFFFKHFETQEIFAQNVDEKNERGGTALHCIARLNIIETAQMTTKRW